MIFVFARNIRRTEAEKICVSCFCPQCYCAGTWYLPGTGSYYIAVCVMFFLLFFWQVNGKREKLWTSHYFSCGPFRYSYLIYRGIAGTWFMAAGDYMEGQSNWGSEPAAECVKNVLRVVKNQLLTVGPRNFSFYVIGVLLAVLCDMDLHGREEQKVDVPAFWNFCSRNEFLCSLHHFLMTIYAGAMLVTRTQFALPVVAAFLAMFGVMILKEQQISDVRPGKTGAGQENVPMAAGNGQCGDIACNRSYRRSGLL